MPRKLSHFLLLAMISCSDNGGPGADSCQIQDLPLTGGPNAPVITDVALEAQADAGIIVRAAATDPQGSDNLQDVPQTIRVFQDERCEGSPIVLQDEVVGSGTRERFGIAIPETDPLFAAISGAERWPVAVEFRDSDNNTTAGRVLARVISGLGSNSRHRSPASDPILE